MDKKEKLRKKVDFVDRKIIFLLAERFKITKEIIFLKKKGGLPVRDVKREDVILKEANKLAKRSKVRPEFITDIFKKILKESKR